MQARSVQEQLQLRQEIFQLVAPNSVAERVLNDLDSRNVYGVANSSFFGYSCAFSETRRVKISEVDKALNGLLKVGLIKWIPGEDRYVRPDRFVLDGSAKHYVRLHQKINPIMSPRRSFIKHSIYGPFVIMGE